MKRDAESIGEEVLKLQRELAAAKQVKAGIRGRRSKVALDAKRGDKAAIRTLAEIERDELKATGDIETLQLAIESAEREFDEARDNEMAADLVSRLSTANDLAAQVIEWSEKADQAVDLLARTLEARAAVLKQMQGLHLLSDDLAGQWLTTNPERISRGVLARLNRVLAIPDQYRSEERQYRVAQHAQQTMGLALHRAVDEVSRKVSQLGAKEA